MVSSDTENYRFLPVAVHPIPENDVWWGKRFTEWMNVTKLCQLLRCYYQSHLPADLGFCDLRVAESREAQEHPARQYGVTGFCYYQYWFAGKRLLNRPVLSRTWFFLGSSCREDLVGIYRCKKAALFSK